MPKTQPQRHVADQGGADQDRPAPDADRLIDAGECERVTGLSRATRLRWEKAGNFPLRVHLGPRTVKWRLSEIRAWMDALPRSAADCAADEPDKPAKPYKARRRKAKAATPPRRKAHDTAETQDRQPA